VWLRTFGLLMTGAGSRWAVGRAGTSVEMAAQFWGGQLVRGTTSRAAALGPQSQGRESEVWGRRSAVGAAMAMWLRTFSLLMTGAGSRWTISEMLLGTPTSPSATATYRARVRRELLPVACTLMLALVFLVPVHVLAASSCTSKCTFLGRTRCRPKRSMAKQNRYRYRYRRDSEWDSDKRDRVSQLCCCSA